MAGMAQLGGARPGPSGYGRRGMARLGTPGLVAAGMVRPGVVRNGKVRLARRVMVRHVTVWPGDVRQGRRGEVGKGVARWGLAGKVSLGVAGCGSAGMRTGKRLWRWRNKYQSGLETFEPFDRHIVEYLEIDYDKQKAVCWRVDASSELRTRDILVHMTVNEAEYFLVNYTCATLKGGSSFITDLEEVSWNLPDN